MEEDLTTSEAIELEPLSKAECLELLATASVGRVAVALPGGPPLVLPVNYALDGEVVVFRSDPGSKLDALREHPASFQVDRIDPFHRTGWSVLVQGFAYETSPADVEVEPWDAGPKAHWVRIYAGGITGRRLTLLQVEPDPRGYL
jgi:nitroimidazol reductase NimA-like FMN-containing flavoprotein (pyridoxamine 5'-phosphate oxidase superfamily)